MMKSFFAWLEEDFEAYMEDLISKVKANPQANPHLHIIESEDEDALIWRL